VAINATDSTPKNPANTSNALSLDDSLSSMSRTVNQFDVIQRQGPTTDLADTGTFLRGQATDHPVLKRRDPPLPALNQ